MMGQTTVSVALFQVVLSVGGFVENRKRTCRTREKVA